MTSRIVHLLTVPLSIFSPVRRKVLVTLLAVMTLTVGVFAAAPAHATATQACIYYRPSPIYAHSQVCAYAWYTGTIIQAVSLTWEERNPIDDVSASIELYRNVPWNPTVFNGASFVLPGDSGYQVWDIPDVWLNDRGQMNLVGHFTRDGVTVSHLTYCQFP